MVDLCEVVAMRLHQPMTALEALERFLGEPGVSQALAVRRVLPAQAPTFAAVPEWLDQRLLGALTRRGISALYSHQREALEALHDGLDIAIVTPTASGKSLCYNLPVLQEISLDPAARARSTSSPPRPSARTSWPSCATWPRWRRWDSRQRSTTATHQRPSGPTCAKPARWW
jgi:hypothetical protein